MPAPKGDLENKDSNVKVSNSLAQAWISPSFGLCDPADGANVIVLCDIPSRLFLQFVRLLYISGAMNMLHSNVRVLTKVLIPM